jgi:hypothetical protein
MWFLLVPATAAAAEPAAPEPDRPELRVSGHLKSFSLAVFPYDHPLLPTAPVGQTVLDARAQARLTAGRVTAEVAHAVTPTLGGGGGLVIADTGVAPTAPELVPLGWEASPADGGSLSAVGRTDRLLVKVAGRGFDLTVGRQPVSFGAGAFFTPLDLVNPFTPTTIDTEYKPGVDAVRLDAYQGVGAQLTVVASWAGAPITARDRDPVGLDDLSAAAVGRAPIGPADVTILLGAIHGDLVAGAGVDGSVGPVRVYGDAAVTVPTTEERPFVRAVVGASHQASERVFLAGEVYVQTLGTSDPEALLPTLQGPRYARGELWLAGVAYAGLAASVEITPLLRGSVGAFVNLGDPSALLAPSLVWSVADDAEVLAGAFAGVGARPASPALPPGFGIRSEFGLYPVVAFTSLRVWF